MEIKTGQTFQNKTLKYLFPCLKAHGEEFWECLREMKVLAAGLMTKLGHPDLPLRGRNIVLIVDISGQWDLHLRFLGILERSGICVLDHYVLPMYLNSDKYLFILRVPEVHRHAHDMFLQGRYSEMYSFDEVMGLFPTASPERAVLLREKSAVPAFLQMLAEEHDIPLEQMPDIIRNAREFDLPPKREEEILDCEKSDRVYIDADLDKLGYHWGDEEEVVFTIHRDAMEADIELGMSVEEQEGMDRAIDDLTGRPKREKTLEEKVASLSVEKVAYHLPISPGTKIFIKGNIRPVIGCGNAPQYEVWAILRASEGKIPRADHDLLRHMLEKEKIGYIIP